jgi:hypothetical protein
LAWSRRRFEFQKVAPSLFSFFTQLWYSNSNHLLNALSSFAQGSVARAKRWSYVQGQSSIAELQGCVANAELIKLSLPIIRRITEYGVNALNQDAAVSEFLQVVITQHFPNWVECSEFFPFRFFRFFL